MKQFIFAVLVALFAAPAFAQQRSVDQDVAEIAKLLGAKKVRYFIAYSKMPLSDENKKAFAQMALSNKDDWYRPYKGRRHRKQYRIKTDYGTYCVEVHNKRSLFIEKLHLPENVATVVNHRNRFKGYYEVTKDSTQEYKPSLMVVDLLGFGKDEAVDPRTLYPPQSTRF